MSTTHKRFSTYAWGVLVYNLGVILWGAYVRATGSGAGCGRHWPLCDGKVVPRPEQVEMLVEFTHRLSSGLSLLLVVGLFVWTFRLYTKGHPVRRGAALALFFICTEALLGAGLVLFELVAKDTSATRAITVSLHLVNTFLLLASLTLTARWASGGPALRLRGQDARLWALSAGLLAVLLLGMTGAVTALGDTLFPPESLQHGLRQDLDPTANFMIRLRVVHPFIAAATGFYLLLIAGLPGVVGPRPEAKHYARWLVALFVTQLGAGLLTVLLLAPIVMQQIHLLLADLTWITLVLLASSALAEPAPQSTNLPIYQFTN